jgi:O-antigen ligase
LYFLFGLLSVTWSDFPEIAIKRWVKSIGDIVMAMLVFTDDDPLLALRRFLARLSFVLFPLSLLFIKYYPNLGRYHEPWTGAMFNGGVTTNKNSLGVVVYLLSLGALWQILRLRKATGEPNRTRRYVAQCAILAFGIWLLYLANSATSTACFTIGCILMLVTTLPRFAGRPRDVQAFVLIFVLVGGLLKFTGADKFVVHALGRKPDLTGRANEIWPLLISMAPNPLLGAGFESFWLGPRLLQIWNAFPNLYVNEAHNGYIEIYLNFGVVGLILILGLLLHGAFTSISGFRIDPCASSLMLAYVLTTAMYSYTEAGFRTLSVPWGFLLIAIIGANSVFKRSEKQSRKVRALIPQGRKPREYVAEST